MAPMGLMSPWALAGPWGGVGSGRTKRKFYRYVFGGRNMKCESSMAGESIIFSKVAFSRDEAAPARD